MEVVVGDAVAVAVEFEMAESNHWADLKTSLAAAAAAVVVVVVVVGKKTLLVVYWKSVPRS